MENTYFWSIGITVFVMAFYGTGILPKMLPGKRMRWVFLVQLPLFWLFEVFLFWATGHTLLNATWLAAILAVGATLTGLANHREQERKKSVTSED